MPIPYQMRRLRGVDGHDLLVHMVSVTGEHAVEFFFGVDGRSVTFTRHQFEQWTQWVHEQFDSLAQEPPATIH